MIQTKIWIAIYVIFFGLLGAIFSILLGLNAYIAFALLITAMIVILILFFYEFIGLMNGE